MRLLLTFIIFILGGFYTFGKENCCEQCCEYLGNCCKKGKGEVKNENNVEEEEEVPEEFYLKKTEQDNLKEEIKKLVNTDWYNNKGKDASFFLYEKINVGENQHLNENDVIKVTKDKNGFTIDKEFITEEDNKKKWALFEIIYKEEKEGVEEEETVYLYCSDIENLDNCIIFSHCKQHVSISVIACDTSNVIDMSNMFFNCEKLKKLDLSKFNTDNVINMSYMFSRCSSLKELDLSKFNTSSVTNMSYMFSHCSYLKELDLSKFNTSSVTNMSGMFKDCSSLTKLNLSNFNTKNVVSMFHMFSGCSSLTELDLSKFNIKKIDMSNMFSDIPNENLNSFTLPESLKKLISNK